MIGWFAPKHTIYVWHDVEELPTEEGIYLVIRTNQGRRGNAHFDMFCPGIGWMQIKGTYAGTVVLWTESPVTPEE